MKESIRRIQQDGYSEPLLELVKRWRIIWLGNECKKNGIEDAYCVFFNSHRLCGYHEGIVEKSASVIVELSLNGVFEVDIASHKLLRVNGKEVSGIEHDQVLDLSDDGERWEGDVLDNQPYGWGVLYDSENRRTYEGFRIGDVSVCYGTQYYPEVGVIDYEGEWFEGKRWGRGIQYDRNGNITINGEWMDDDIKMEKRVVIDSGISSFQNRIEELIVSDGCCSGKERIVLDFYIINKLRVFIVGDECFGSVRVVGFVEMNDLERVVIGANCFTKHKNDSPRSIIPNGYFCLENCARLRELKIGRYSFSDYYKCEIENLPSLEVIEMGDLNEWSDNFHNASMTLKSSSQRMK